MLEYYSKLFTGTPQEFYSLLDERICENKKTFIITANPESFMTGRKNPEFHKALMCDDAIITADGIGVVKGAKTVGLKVSGRVTGVETVEYLLKCADERGLSLYVYGSRPEVLKAFAAVLSEKYSRIKIAGLHDGYSGNSNEVFSEIADLSPDLVFTCLGIPRQELSIYENLNHFNKGIFIGCGGSIDVLSGSKKRAPKIFIKLGLEWLYRIMSEPKRLGRFYQNNIKFFHVLKKEIKK